MEAPHLEKIVCFLSWNYLLQYYACHILFGLQFVYLNQLTIYEKQPDL